MVTSVPLSGSEWWISIQAWHSIIIIIITIMIIIGSEWWISIQAWHLTICHRASEGKGIALLVEWLVTASPIHCLGDKQLVCLGWLVKVVIYITKGIQHIVMMIIIITTIFLYCYYEIQHCALLSLQLLLPTWLPRTWGRWKWSPGQQRWCVC